MAEVEARIAHFAVAGAAIMAGRCSGSHCAKAESNGLIQKGGEPKRTAEMIDKDHKNICSGI